MSDLNQVVLIGRVTRDPELRHTPGGVAVAEMSLAVNRTWFDKSSNEKRESVSFCDITLWSRTAEIACEYLRKGSQCAITGRLEQQSWEDKETGQKRSKLKVVGESLQLLGGKQEQRQDSGPAYRPQVDDGETPF